MLLNQQRKQPPQKKKRRHKKWPHLRNLKKKFKNPDEKEEYTIAGEYAGFVLIPVL
jgi:hypothetical protein